jgi:DNA mismatch endonuclease, patch repair protein
MSRETQLPASRCSRETIKCGRISGASLDKNTIKANLYQYKDPLSKAERSALMAKVKCGDTKPELSVRRAVHAMGYRYRLHLKSLPGKPDLVFIGRRKVIFVHGCFWHDHHGCPGARIPKSNTHFWMNKIDGNRRRDRRVIRLLKFLGWRVLVVWECQIGRADGWKKRIAAFLEK